MCISTRNCCRIIHRCYWTSVRSVLWKYWPSSSLWTEPQATSINLQNRTPYVLSDVTLQCIDQIQINRIPADIEKLLITKEACWSALQLFSLSKFHSKTELCPLHLNSEELLSPCCEFLWLIFLFGLLLVIVVVVCDCLGIWWPYSGNPVRRAGLINWHWPIWLSGAPEWGTCCAQAII